MHILQAVIEQAFQKSRVVDVNQTFIDIKGKDKEEATFKINYGGFPAQKRDQGNDKVYKWYKNI